MLEKLFSKSILQMITLSNNSPIDTCWVEYKLADHSSHSESLHSLKIDFFLSFYKQKHIFSLQLEFTNLDSKATRKNIS